jgi:hypothetical protein
MTAAKLSDRLTALESKTPDERPPVRPPYGIWMMSYHLGKWTGEKESVAEASARAMGYEGVTGSMEMAREMQRDPEAFCKRYEGAFKRMMLGAGCDMATATPEERETSFGRLWDATPWDKMPECRGS